MEEGSGRRLVASAGRGGDGREQQELRRVPVGGELRRGGGCVLMRGGARLRGKWGEEVEGSNYRGSGGAGMEGRGRSGREIILSITMAMDGRSSQGYLRKEKKLSGQPLERL